MKALGILLTMAVLLAAAPALAGTVYRCDSADGGRSYVSKRISGAKCEAIGSYAKPSRRAVARPSPPATATLGNAAAASDGRASSATSSRPDPGAPATAFSASERPAMAVSVPATSLLPPPAQPQFANGRRLVQGQVYAYIKDGVRHYTSQAPRGVAGASAVRTIRYSFLEACFACAVNPGVNFGTLRLNTAAYQAEIHTAARQHGVDEAIVRAIIHAESAFNPNALSRVGAQGLMQLMPATARRFGVGNAFDASQNIQGGVQYLAWLLKRFNGDLTLAAAGYNAGEGAVDRYKGVPPYSETQRYVQRVAVLVERYRGNLAAK